MSVRDYPPESGPEPGIWYVYPNKAAYDAAAQRQLERAIAMASPYINTSVPGGRILRGC